MNEAKSDDPVPVDDGWETHLQSYPGNTPDNTITPSQLIEEISTLTQEHDKEPYQEKARSKEITPGDVIGSWPLLKKGEVGLNGTQVFIMAILEEIESKARTATSEIEVFLRKVLEIDPPSFTREGLDELKPFYESAFKSVASSLTLELIDDYKEKYPGEITDSTIQKYYEPLMIDMVKSFSRGKGSEEDDIRAKALITAKKYLLSLQA